MEGQAKAIDVEKKAKDQAVEDGCATMEAFHTSDKFSEEKC